MPQAPRVTVLVTQRESYHHTRRSLDSLYATTLVSFDLVYIDAGSPPPVQRRIKIEARRHAFRVIRRERFLSSNASRNVALGAIETEFVAFVDNDIIFCDGWLERLLACADETGADVVGPLVCIGEPPFQKVHFAGGVAHVEESEAGRRFNETYRFVDRPLVAVADQLVRQPVEMLEFHCMLVRRSIFDRIGLLDEKLETASDHLDICMLVRQNGGTVVFEPDAVVNHLLPPLFPFDLQSLSFFLQRWSSRKNHVTIEHFRKKWNLQDDDRALDLTLEWLDERRGLIFKRLRPALLRRGLKSLKGISNRQKPGAAA